jgi:large subunit ribosomal protein L21
MKTTRPTCRVKNLARVSGDNDYSSRSFSKNSGIDSFQKSGSMSDPLRENHFMYAVLETGSKQYRVAAGDKLEIERLEVEAGKPVTFDRVLLVNNGGKLAVGAPTVSGATVTADVVEHKRGEKKLTFKMKRRKGYHKTIGHRQELTVVKITAINA